MDVDERDGAGGGSGGGVGLGKDATMFTPSDLQRFIEQGRIQATLIAGSGETPTVPAAAAVLGVDPDQIIKTLLFLVDGPAKENGTPQSVVVISHGQQRVDKRRLGEHFGVGKKHVELAPAAVVLAQLGYPAGGVPPFGHATALPVIVDASILALQERFGGVIFGGGGDDRTMMRLTVAELLRVTQPTVVAVGQVS